MSFVCFICIKFLNKLSWKRFTFFSFISAITILGTPAEIYVFGTQYWMIGLSYPFVLAATAHIYLPVYFRWYIFLVSLSRDRRPLSLSLPPSRPASCRVKIVSQCVRGSERSEIGPDKQIQFKFKVSILILILIRTFQDHIKSLVRC